MTLSGNDLSGASDNRDKSLINAPSGFADPSLAVAEVISHFGASSRCHHGLQCRGCGCELKISEKELLFGSRVRFHAKSYYPDGGTGNGGLR